MLLLDYITNNTTMTHYTVGIRVPGTSNPHLHMTLCYLGDLDITKVEALKGELDQLCKDILPLEIVFGERALFGPQNNIPVRLVAIKDAQKRAALDAFYQKHHKPEQGLPDSDTQNFHVTIKSIMNEADALDTVQLSRVFMKQLGPHDPVWESS